MPLFTKILKSPSSERRLFLYILYFSHINLPEMKRKSPWIFFEIYHMYMKKKQ